MVCLMSAILLHISFTLLVNLRVWGKQVNVSNSKDEKTRVDYFIWRTCPNLHVCWLWHRPCPLQLWPVISKKIYNSKKRNSGNNKKQVLVLHPSVFKPKCIGWTRQCKSHGNKVSQTTFSLDRTLSFYLVSRQRIQTRILLNVPRSNIKTSTMKRTPHSLTDQCSWIEGQYKSTLINITA